MEKDKDNLFQECALKITNIGETTVIISLERELDGHVRMMLHGTAESILFAAANLIYRMHKDEDYPLKELGKILNEHVSRIEELDRGGAICDKVK